MNPTRERQHNDPPPVYIVDSGKVRELTRAEAQEMEYLLATKTANQMEA